MRSKVASIGVVVFVFAAATYAIGRGYIDGAAAAVSDYSHGKSRFLYLGCSYSPRGAYEERRDALLMQKYHLSYGAIGGIGPTNHDVQYQTGNNLTAWVLLRIKYGAGFEERVERQARVETDARPPAR